MTMNRAIILAAIILAAIALLKWARTDSATLPADDGPIVLYEVDGQVYVADESSYAVLATGPGWRAGT